MLRKLNIEDKEEYMSFIFPRDLCPAITVSLSANFKKIGLSASR